jgi:hypothetical protein
MSEEEIALKITESPSSQSSKEFRRETEWKSCCLTLDRRAVRFFSQLVISLIIIVFCLFQLHTLDKCESSEYLSLLTMVLGIYIEAPRLHR